VASWSAVITLRHAGAKTVLMTTRYASPESYAAFNLGGRAMFRVPIATRGRVTRIVWRPALEAVETEHFDTGERRLIPCDTVVFTGDWIPDHELARSAGIEIDASTRGPLVDPSLHTSRAGVFAAGNVVHPVDTADIAAVDGTFVADEVARYLTGSRPPRGSALRLRPGSGLRWIAPGLIRDATFGPPRGRLLAWTDELVRFPKVTVSQGGCVVAEKRLVWPASPGRVFRIPAHILDRVDHRGGDVISDIANASAMSVSRPDSAVVNVG
jgi:hypothetical protein